MMARSRAITAVHRLIIAMIGLMAAVGVHSQELNCVVEVDATQVEGSRHVSVSYTHLTLPTKRT